MNTKKLTIRDLKNLIKAETLKQYKVQSKTSEKLEQIVKFFKVAYPKLIPLYIPKLRKDSVFFTIDKPMVSQIKDYLRDNDLNTVSNLLDSTIKNNMGMFISEEDTLSDLSDKIDKIYRR